MATTTVTTRVSPGLDAIKDLTKILYADGKPPVDVQRESPFVSQLKIKESSGESMKIPIIYGDAVGIARTRSGSQTVNSASGNRVVRAKAWNVEMGDLTQTMTLDIKQLMSAKSNAGGFVDQQTVRLQSHGREAIRTVASLLLSPPGRALASGTISAGVLTLANPSDSIKFQVGHLVQASGTSGATTGTLLGSGSIGYVIAVDKIAGTVTVSDTAGGTAGVPGSWTGTMYFFLYETYGGIADNVIFKGLEDWIPESAPTSGDNFYGVDRSVDPTALAGVRVPSSVLAGKSALERIRIAAMYINSRTSGVPDVCWVNPEDWLNIENEFHASGQRDNMVKDQTFGFSKLSLITATGTVEIVSDPMIRKGHAFLLDNRDDNVVFYNMMGKQLFSILDQDGNMELRQATSDTLEWRWLSFPAFVVRCPGRCGRVALP